MTGNRIHTPQACFRGSGGQIQARLGFAQRFLGTLAGNRITSYNVCYTKLLRGPFQLLLGDAPGKLRESAAKNRDQLSHLIGARSGIDAEETAVQEGGIEGVDRIG